MIQMQRIFSHRRRLRYSRDACQHRSAPEKISTFVSLISIAQHGVDGATQVYSHCSELTIHQGCLVVTTVIVPQQIRQLHEAHS